MDAHSATPLLRLVHRTILALCAHGLLLVNSPGCSATYLGADSALPEGLVEGSSIDFGAFGEGDRSADTGLGDAPVFGPVSHDFVARGPSAPLWTVESGGDLPGLLSAYDKKTCATCLKAAEGTSSQWAAFCRENKRADACYKYQHSTSTERKNFCRNEWCTP